MWCTDGSRHPLLGLGTALRVADDVVAETPFLQVSRVEAPAERDQMAENAHEIDLQPGQDEENRQVAETPFERDVAQKPLGRAGQCEGEGNGREQALGGEYDAESHDDP